MTEISVASFVIIGLPNVKTSLEACNYQFLVLTTCPQSRVTHPVQSAVSPLSPHPSSLNTRQRELLFLAPGPIRALSTTFLQLVDSF